MSLNLKTRNDEFNKEFKKLWEIGGFDAIPKQRHAWDKVWLARYVLYGGARGPGKSRWLRWSLLFMLLVWWQQGFSFVRVGLFCEDYPSLKDRQISKIEREFPEWLGEVKSTKSEGLGFYLHERFGGGAILLKNLDKPEKYQSAEFAAIGVDELTKNPYETFTILRGSLRWPGISHTPFLGATNPGSIGHLWVKALWVDKSFINYPELVKRKEEFAFIQALPKDNPFLDEAYWEELESLPEQLYKAWVLGDWNVFEGQVFMEWMERDENGRPYHVIEPSRIPPHWPKWRSLDWGYNKPWCCLWWAQDPDSGRRYIYREAYGVGLTDRAQARLIKRVTNENIERTWADPACWATKNVKDVVTTIADEYAAEGVPLMKANNDRINGKMKVHNVLAPLPDGLPGLQVFRTCSNLIRTLPALPYDDTNVEDVDTDAEDHAYDATRYGLTVMKKDKKGEPDHETERYMRSISQARSVL